MFSTLRRSMNWLHIWSGVTLGPLLLTIFFMGSLSVFDHEIDRWMMPATRLSPPSGPISLDLLRPRIDELVAGADEWRLVLPDERTPFAQLGFRGKRGAGNIAINPANGDILPDAGTLGATRFFYPFHYSLLVRVWNVGIWVVGAAAMAMLVLSISGVIIRTRIFENFFTYRPNGTLLRGSFDLHAVIGVVTLPFLLAIPFSGLVIFSAVYLPAGIEAAYPGKADVFFDEASGALRLRKAGAPGELGSLDAMRAEAERRWGDGEAALLRVVNASDVNAVVEWRRMTKDRVRDDGQSIFFDRAGRLLRQSVAGPAKSTVDFIWGMHLMRFDHWPLRWLYFFAGLGGCVVITTGFVIWMEKRKAKPHPTGVRIVETAAISAIPGLLSATFGFFVVNRLLPLATPGRAQWEVAAFFAIWAASAVYAGWRVSRGRARSAWRDESWAVCALAGAAPILNWITTGGDHLAESLAHGRWAVAGTDLGLLASSLIAAVAAKRIASESTHAGRDFRIRQVNETHV
jgi:uncharacterized iron-regulated membrane protein